MMDLLNRKTMWNDGPPMVDFMGSDAAPAIARQHLCYGGGSSGGAPAPPDYSQYISAMTAAGNADLSKSSDLYDWAKTQGQALQTTANAAGQRAGTLSDATIGTDPRLEAMWEQTYGPLYQAQAADAMRLNQNLPATEEQWAGKYGADTAQAFDASKATQNRTLQGYGLKMPGLGSAALDMTSANQRAAAIAAANETGRLAADTTARGATQQAIQTGTTIPQIGAQQSQLGLGAGAQSVALPSAAITTTAGSYSPALNYNQLAYPYLSQWGSTMGNAYNQSLAQFNANSNSGGGAGAMMGAGLGALGQIGGAYAGSSSGSAAISSLFRKGGVVQKFDDGGQVISGMNYPGDPMYSVWDSMDPNGPAKYDEGEQTGSAVGGTIGHIAGNMFGPIGGIAGREIGSRAGAGVGAAVQGKWGDAVHDITAGTPLALLKLANGGDVTPASNPNFVHPDASPSRGAITDDVPARLNAGEFVFPKDVVAWRGEQWMQKEIQKAREDRQKNETAKPEMSSAATGGAIRAMAPTFISEGARV